MVLRDCFKLCAAAAAVLMTVMATVAAFAQSPATRISTAKDRTQVSITVYNQNFGLVREVRRIDVGQGQAALEFRDVAAQIQPETVHVKADGLKILEQNYRYDLLSPETLLDKYVGKGIRIHRYNQRTGQEKSFDAKLLSVANNRPVLQVNGEVTFDFPGRLAFPEVPAELVAKPTLMWLVDSRRPQQDLEVTYLARALNWKADYVLVINDDDTGGDLKGWVTLTNNSGATYEGARLKLVAGDVHRVSPRMPPPRAYHAGKSGAADGEGFREESFFEYHLYTLQQPTDIRNKEQKQVTLLDASDVAIRKKLIFHGQQYWFRGRHGQVQSNQKVGVYLDLKNAKENGLGLPLPKGTVRVYKKDRSGAQQFIGEDNIDHTPRDEKVRVRMGEAFDIVGERKQTDFDKVSRCVSESAWEIELRNHKDQAEQVQVFEPVGGDWTLLSSSQPHKKEDARTFTFDVSVPANGKTKIRYRVRVRWC